MAAPASAAAPACSTSSPSVKSYYVQVCVKTPADATTLKGDTAITLIVTIRGTDPGYRRATFYLDGVYLLTDFQAPFTFTLPTSQWVDGIYKLEARVHMRDGFITGRTVSQLTFRNGITEKPVNEKRKAPTSGRASAVGQPFVVIATGDGAGGEINANKVLNLIDSQKPNLLLYLGDVYEKGTFTEFYNWYGANGTNYNRFYSITNPTIGNHEYSASRTANGYFQYWNNIPSYYSYDAGGWHFISLNSNTRREPGHIESEQYAWLQQDLEKNQDTCTIVYYHHPYFSVTAVSTRGQMDDMWQLMTQHGVSIVLNGHEHNYQRWAPLDAKGRPNPNGITQFVAGGGGHGVQGIVNKDPRVVYANADNPTSLGALKLSLTPGQARYQYLSITGAVLDAGTIHCK